jgi:hypothetical protein
MSTQPLRMIDDPRETDYIKDLLQAGASDEILDYNYEEGLGKHLALIASGALPPAWADSPQAATKAALASTVKAAAVWLGLPLATVSVVTAVLFTANDVPRVTKDKSPTTSIQESRVDRQNDQQQQVRVSQEKSIERVDHRVQQHIGKTARNTPAESYFGRHSTRGGYATGPTARESAGNRRVDQTRYRSNGLQDDRYTKINPYTTPSAVNKSSVPSSREDKLSSYGVEHSASVNASRQTNPQKGNLTQDTAKSTSGAAEEGKIYFNPQPIDQVEEQKPAERKIADPLEREMRMLAAANRLLQNNPERALELAQKGEMEFPRGIFAEERRQLLVLALIKLGRENEARRLGLNYLRRYPSGPFSDRVRRALATGIVPEE